MSNVKGRDTLRCNGIPKHRSAAPILPSCARPGSTARGLDPAQNWVTASNTRSPRDAWRRCPPPVRPATARAGSQPGEALLDSLGGQPVVSQRVLVLGSPCAGLTFAVTIFHRLPGFVG